MLMSLTGTALLVLLVAATITVFILLVVFWPRFAAPSVGPIVARASMLVLVNALVLLTASVMVNDTYLFYASWADLHGALTGTVATTSLDRGAQATVPARTAVLGRHANVTDRRAGSRRKAAVRLPTLQNFRVPGARVLTFRVHGRASGITSTVVVELPPGYLKPANAGRRYPVLEAFAGYPGSPYQWSSAMNLGGVMAHQVAMGHMRPALVVEPEQWIPPDVDTECVNGVPRNPQVETWLTVDVPSWVTHTFRVATGRSSWAAIGLSAGGWCANMAAMLHPAQYGAAIDMGGYFRPEIDPFYEPYPPTSRLTDRYDLVARAQRDPPPVAIWLETSHADLVSYHSTAAFLKVARSPLSVHAVVLQNVGHRIGVWQGLLPQSLRWLGSALPGFGARR